MIDLFETILAAGKRRSGLEWLIPLIFAITYVAGAIGKAKRQKEEEKKLDEELTKIDKEPMPERAQPETIYMAPPKEILQKKLRAQQALAAQLQQRKTARTKPQPRKIKKSAQAKVKAEELEILPETPESMIKYLRQPQTIRDAIVFSEIIGKPRSLQQWEY